MLVVPELAVELDLLHQTIRTRKVKLDQVTSNLRAQVSLVYASPCLVLISN